MKIAVFTDTFLPQMNGVVSYLLDSLEELSKKYEVVVFAPGKDKLEIEEKNYRIYWIPASPFPFYEGYKIASMNYARVSELIKKEKPDIIHAHAPVVLGVQGIVCGRINRIPIVVTHHTHFPDYVPHLLNGKLPEQFESVSELTVKKLIKHVFENVDIVTAPTNELVCELSSYGLKNVVHLPNGVKLKKFRYSRKEGEKFRKKLGIPARSKVVLYLGRVSYEKKLDILIHAFNMVNDGYLVIAGKGPYLDDLKKHAEALSIKNIRYTGFLDEREIIGAYSSADVFASPSDSETFGLTFVEAMACKRPVIGVSKLGAKEIILNGKTGILVEPQNARKLANAIKKLFKNKKLRDEYGQNGYERAKTYSLRKSIEETRKIYQSLKPE